MLRTTWIWCFFLLLTSCFRPHYIRQPLDIPQEWRLDTNEGSTLSNLNWWKQFQDPVLNRLIITALKNNEDLQVAMYRVREFLAQLGIVSADLYPGITGNASYMRLKFSSDRPHSADRLSESKHNKSKRATKLLREFPPVNEYKAFLNLNWALDFWSRYYSASEAAYEEYLGTIQARRSVVITVVTSVAMTYINLRNLDAQLKISKQTLESRYESLKLAQDRFELGETSSLEVIQAQAEIEIAALRVIEFERAIPIAEDQLSVLLGENPQWIERGSSIQEFQYPVTIPAGLPSDLLTRRPDIVKAEDTLKAANARVTEARALLFPQFNLTAMYGSESFQLKTFLTSPAEMWEYGVSAVQTIFDAGRIFYGIEEASAIREEALANYRQTILIAFQEVNDALIQVRKNRELVTEHQVQVKILKEYLRLATLRYNEGEVDYLNVLDAERTLFTAQLNLAQSEADSFTAIVKLYGALGGGWVDETDAIAISNQVSINTGKRTPGIDGVVWKTDTQKMQTVYDLKTKYNQ